MEIPVVPAVVDGAAAAWLALRLSRPAGEDGRFRGATGARAPTAYRVSALERYLDCPFKYFAGRVLRVEEERDEEPGLSALERGRLVHEVFEAFFTAWQAGGGGAITPSNLREAIDAFTRVAEARLETLPEADRALERARLLGSAAASGLGGRAFEFEVESGAAVVERLLEHALEGTFAVEGPDGPREVELRGKADRIDLLADGTLRLVDYKLGRAPKAARAIQLPVYGVCAEQRLRGRRGRDWRFGAAGYLAFGERQPFVAMEGRQPFADAVAEGVERLLAAVDGIERGEFPVRPDEPFLCTYCAYPSVCRKDYVGDE
jgi:ATP-dependent helicase/nuclease subunit B